jgi:hypothetical protein
VTRVYGREREIWNMDVIKRRNSDERMDEGGGREKVGVESIALVVGNAKGELLHQGLDVLDCSERRVRSTGKLSFFSLFKNSEELDI